MNQKEFGLDFKELDLVEGLVEEGGVQHTKGLPPGERAALHQEQGCAKVLGVLLNKSQKRRLTQLASKPSLRVNYVQGMVRSPQNQFLEAFKI
jgi:hypothetical protein